MVYVRLSRRAEVEAPVIAPSPSWERAVRNLSNEGSVKGFSAKRFGRRSPLTHQDLLNRNHALSRRGRRHKYERRVRFAAANGAMRFAYCALLLVLLRRRN